MRQGAQTVSGTVSQSMGSLRGQDKGGGQGGGTGTTATTMTTRTTTSPASRSKPWPILHTGTCARRSRISFTLTHETRSTLSSGHTEYGKWRKMLRRILFRPLLFASCPSRHESYVLPFPCPHPAFPDPAGPCPGSFFLVVARLDPKLGFLCFRCELTIPEVSPRGRPK